uniref:Uncharacterized protein n=1 Tax=Pyxicephalus adspersus TaxID=30357 RepID=A0AAV3AUU6_PYXAD|nr:TPA: hypothetical protein GDO54_008383 [Pyxicephalus adspersus]
MDNRTAGMLEIAFNPPGRHCLNHKLIQTQKYKDIFTPLLQAMFITENNDTTATTARGAAMICSTWGRYGIDSTGCDILKNGCRS